ncbi:helix-turn-helix domain-containing protein [Blautia schinkii]|nr:helix-turn-helix domain-containing protein [Blautia schinkii]
MTSKICLEEIDIVIYCLISSLRKNLEPDLRRPRYIHMVREVGYKFGVLPGE